MKGRSVALFALGLLLALLAYPVALFVSFPVAYAFAVIALMLGAVIVAKKPSEGELVIGMVLAVTAAAALGGESLLRKWRQRCLRRALKILQGAVG